MFGKNNYQNAGDDLTGRKKADLTAGTCVYIRIQRSICLGSSRFLGRCFNLLIKLKNLWRSAFVCKNTISFLRMRRTLSAKSGSTYVILEGTLVCHCSRMTLGQHLVSDFEFVKHCTAVEVVTTSDFFDTKFVAITVALLEHNLTL